AKFRGERQDLEEMVGNLVDNACKWAQSRVAVETSVERPDAQSERRILRIVVDDDGPGLTPQQREQVARPGRRLDETKPGPVPGTRARTERAEAGMGVWARSGGRARKPLWRGAHPRHRADRGLARGADAARRVVQRRIRRSVTANTVFDDRRR